MIAGYFHQGSGLGNQLFRYITVRTVAQKLNVPFVMFPTLDGSGKEVDFKGKSFLSIDEGEVSFEPHIQWKRFNEKKVTENSVDIRGYDPEINFVEDNTIIEGEFQDERYWDIQDVKKWLRHDGFAVADDTCIIGFRGGEYAVFPDLFLTRSYWDTAIARMRYINPGMQFHVVTDDPLLAKQFFPDFTVTHSIKFDWLKCRFAKYAIIANSSFYIIPRLLAHLDKDAVTISPRYWARHNTKTWALPQNYYKAFTYL